MSSTEARDGAATGATGMGIEENVAASLAYVLIWVTGLVVYWLERKNSHVRFHAAQSTIFFGGMTIVTGLLTVLYSTAPFRIVYFFALVVAALLTPLIWLYLVLGTFGHGDPRIPIAAEFASRVV